MEKQSFWEVTKKSSIGTPAKGVIQFMMQQVK